MVKKNKDKEALLLQSFEILKTNLEDNESKIQEIIAKIAKINTSLAIEVWKFVLTNGESMIKKDGYSFTSGMLYQLERKIGNEEVIIILNENNDILEYVYGKSNSIYASYIWDALKYGYLELAEKMYVLVKKNRYKEESLSSIVEEICESFANEFEYIHDVDEDEDEENNEEDELRANEVASILLKWVSALKNKEAKARISVTLIDYI